MGFGVKKFFFGATNKGPLESRTAVYAHKDRPIVDFAQNLGMKTEFDFMGSPWTVTYTGTAKQWGEFSQRYPDAPKQNPANTRKANNVASRPAQRKTRSRRRR